jgi:hypothetical protein
MNAIRALVFKGFAGFWRKKPARGKPASEIIIEGRG